MAIEFIEGRYFVGIWFGDLGGDGDVMAAAFKDEDAKSWTLIHRHREKVDDKIWDSDDTKEWQISRPEHFPLTEYTEDRVKDFYDAYFEMVSSRRGYIFTPIHRDGGEWFEESAKAGTFPDFMKYRRVRFH